MSLLRRRDAVWFALALGLGGLYSLSLDWLGSSETLGRERYVFPQFAPEDLSAIQVVQKAHSIELLRDESALLAWRFANEKLGEPDAASLRSLLDHLSNLQFSDEYFGADAAPCGGEVTQAIQIESRFGTYEIHLFEKELSHLGFRNHEEDRCLRIDESIAQRFLALSEQLKMRATDLSDISHLKELKIASLAKESDGSVDIRIDEQGLFRSNFGRVNSQFVESLLSVLRRTIEQAKEIDISDVKAFASASDKKTFFRKLPSLVQLKRLDDSDFVLAEAGRCPGFPDNTDEFLALTNEPAPRAYCLSRGSWEGMIPGAELLRDPRVIPFPSSDIEEVILKRAGASLELARSEGGFVLRDSVATDISFAAGQSVLDRMTALRGTLLSEVDSRALLSEFTDSSSVIEIAVRSPRSDVKGYAEELLKIKKTKAELLIWRRSDELVLKLPAALASRFEWGKELFRETSILDTDVKSIRSVELKTKAGHYLIDCSEDSPVLKVASKKASLDPLAVGNWLQNLSRIESDRWIPADALKDLNFTSELLIQIQKDGGIQTLHLRLSPTPSGYLAALDGEAMLLEFSQAKVNEWFTMPFERRDFSLKAEQLERVELEGSGRSWSFQNYGDELLVVQGGELSPAVLHELFLLFTELEPSPVELLSKEFLNGSESVIANVRFASKGQGELSYQLLSVANHFVLRRSGETQSFPVSEDVIRGLLTVLKE